MASVISVCFLLAQMIIVSAVTLGQEECGNEQLCYNKPDDYPQNTIDEYLAKHSPLPYKPDNDDEDIQKMMYEVDDDDINCSTEVRLEKPFTLRHQKRSYPVIQSKYFTQRIRQVSCKSNGRPCFNGISISSPYNATCKTEQGKIQLYVFDDEKNDVVAMTADYNCCCKCIIS